MNKIYFLVFLSLVSCSKEKDVAPDDIVNVEYYIEGSNEDNIVTIVSPGENHFLNDVDDGLLMDDKIPATFRINFSVEHRSKPNDNFRIYIKHNGKEVLSTSEYEENDYGRYVAEIKNVSIWEKVYRDK